VTKPRICSECVEYVLTKEKRPRPYCRAFGLARKDDDKACRTDRAVKRDDGQKAML
jgi:hypothetical protein